MLKFIFNQLLLQWLTGDERLEEGRDALCDLVPSAQFFKKKTPWRSDTCCVETWNYITSNTPRWVFFTSEKSFHECFSFSYRVL